MIAEPLNQRTLYFGVIEFAHVSLLQLAVNVVAIRTIAAVQILANRNR
jgi:hypothetical protein